MKTIDDILGTVMWAFIFLGIYAGYWLPIVFLIVGVWLGMELEYE